MMNNVQHQCTVIGSNCISPCVCTLPCQPAFFGQCENPHFVADDDDDDIAKFTRSLLFR